MIRKSSVRTPPISLARRHFMGIVAAGAGRLSTIAISSALLASSKALMQWVYSPETIGITTTIIATTIMTTTIIAATITIVSDGERLF